MAVQCTSRDSPPGLLPGSEAVVGLARARRALLRSRTSSGGSVFGWAGAADVGRRGVCDQVPGDERQDGGQHGQHHHDVEDVDRDAAGVLAAAVAGVAQAASPGHDDAHGGFRTDQAAVATVEGSGSPWRVPRL